jgi:DNA-directed RNA polymerase subunit F
MIVKEVLNEELLTLAEVRELLLRIAEERREQGLEVGYGFRKALHHAEQFSKISGEKSRELVNRLLELEKMKPSIAIRIADILPQSWMKSDQFMLKKNILWAMRSLIKSSIMCWKLLNKTETQRE